MHQVSHRISSERFETNLPDIRNRKIRVICKGKSKWLSISGGISDPRCQHQVSSRSKSNPQSILKATNEYKSWN